MSNYSAAVAEQFAKTLLPKISESKGQQHSTRLVSYL